MSSQQTALSTESSVAQVTITNLLWVFLGLQFVDALTTLLVLRVGGQELNPFVRTFIRLGPGFGLLLGKGIVLAIAAYVAVTNRRRVLVIANAFYILLAMWNIVVLVLQRMHTA